MFSYIVSHPFIVPIVGMFGLMVVVDIQKNGFVGVRKSYGLIAAIVGGLSLLNLLGS